MKLHFLDTECLVLDTGGSGIVIQHHKSAIKLPRSYLYGRNEDEDGAIEWEKKVYQRLGKCEGVVDVLDFSGPGIRMVWMANGSLRNYLENHEAPPRPLQLTWFRQMARTLALVHDRRVLVADIATRNFLVAADLSIKFSDFTESSIFELECDMQTIDENGYSIYTDIGQLGSVFYEVATGEKCDFDLFQGQAPGPASAVWPQRMYLPSTEMVWLGGIIEQCWEKGAFRDAHQLSSALDSVSI